MKKTKTRRFAEIEKFFKKRMKGDLDSLFRLIRVSIEDIHKTPIAILQCKEAPELGLLIRLQESGGTLWRINFSGLKDVPLLCACCLNEQEHAALANSLSVACSKNDIKILFLRHASRWAQWNTTKSICLMHEGDKFMETVHLLCKEDVIEKICRIKATFK